MKSGFSRQNFHNSELPDLLGVRESRIITLVGAGGKTTLLYALSHSFSNSGFRTLLTTTTHIFRPDPEDLSVFLVEDENKTTVQKAFSHSSLTALGIPSKQKGKWKSPSSFFLRSISSIPDKIVCEGDGSKGLPIKIPRAHEPMLFPKTDTVIGVLGLSSLGCPTREYLFGWERWKDSLPEIVTPSLLSRIAMAPDGIFKNCQNAKKLLIFNQADTLSEGNADALMKEIKKIRDNGIICLVASLEEMFLLV